MSDGRLRAEWDQTAALWAPLANWVRDAERRPEPFTEADRHPYLLRERPTAPKPAKQSIMVLRGLFPPDPPKPK